MQQAAAKAKAKVSTRGEAKGSPAKQASFLIVFPGDNKLKDRLAEQIGRRIPEASVVELDIINHKSQDLTFPLLQAAILDDISQGKYQAVHFALPCSSCSIVRGDQLRSKKQPRFVDGVDARWHKYLLKHDSLCDFVALCIDLLDAQGLRWTFERPGGARRRVVAGVLGRVRRLGHGVGSRAHQTHPAAWCPPSSHPAMHARL